MKVYERGKYCRDTEDKERSEMLAMARANAKKRSFKKIITRKEFNEMEKLGLNTKGYLILDEVMDKHRREQMYGGKDEK